MLSSVHINELAFSCVFLVFCNIFLGLTKLYFYVNFAVCFNLKLKCLEKISRVTSHM